jgi:hypothetical protein
VLERLTQYATATRAAGEARSESDATTTPPEPPDAPSAAEPEREPPGDDILPRAKRTPRGKR